MVTIVIDSTPDGCFILSPPCYEKLETMFWTVLKICQPCGEELCSPWWSWFVYLNKKEMQIVRFYTPKALKIQLGRKLFFYETHTWINTYPSNWSCSVADVSSRVRPWLRIIVTDHGIIAEAETLLKQSWSLTCWLGILIRAHSPTWRFGLRSPDGPWRWHNTVRDEVLRFNTDTWF